MFLLIFILFFPFSLNAATSDPYMIPEGSYTLEKVTFYEHKGAGFVDDDDYPIALKGYIMANIKFKGRKKTFTVHIADSISSKSFGSNVKNIQNSKWRITRKPSMIGHDGKVRTWCYRMQASDGSNFELF